ncbi:ALP1-like protein [Tanacetum coccineum]
MLEIVASYKLWILRAFFGISGANNDFNVLPYSSLFDDIIDDIDHVAVFEVNGVTYEKWYYLADEIYPRWTTFVKSLTVARDEKHGMFKRLHESARKDVERAFGVLKGRMQSANTLESTSVNTTSWDYAEMPLEYMHSRDCDQASCYLAVPFPNEKAPTKKITDFNGLFNKKNSGQ